MNEQAPSALKPETTTPATVAVSGAKRRRGQGWLWLLLLTVLGLGAWYLYWRSHPAKKSTAATSGAATPATAGRTRGMAPAPVIAVESTSGDIGVYFTALGTVTPIYTVTVKSRVDGELMHVYYTEGKLVHEGDPLVDIDPRPFQAQLTQYEGQLLRDQAALDNARTDLLRYQTLITRKAVPQQTLATQQATVVQDEGTVKTDQGLIQAVKLNLIYCHITAPITGRLGLRLVDPGSYVQAASATPLAVITQVNPISAIFTLSEDQLPAVLRKTHAGIRLHVQAYSRDMSTVLSQGFLTTLDNQIDQTTGTLKLRAVLDNKQGMLVANQFVNAKLLVQQKHGVTLLPNAAIQRNAQKTYVYVVQADHIVTIRYIGTGTTDGVNTEITSGLSPGEAVVMTGVDNLREGMKVNPQMTGTGTNGK